MEKDNPDMSWRLKVGALTKAMSQAFGPTVAPRNVPTNLPAVTKGSSQASSQQKKSKTRSKTTFLTETEVGEETKKQPEPQPQPQLMPTGELSYEDLIKEVDQMMDGLYKRDREMEELRKRLKTCNKNIKVQRETSENINRSAKELDTNASSMYSQIKSYSVLPRIAEESLSLN